MEEAEITFLLKSKSLGDIKLRKINTTTIRLLEDSKDALEDDKAYVCRLLHNHIISPQLSLQEFKEISETELREVTLAYLQKHEDIYKHFNQTSEKAFFRNVKTAFHEYLAERSFSVFDVVRSLVPEINEQFQKEMMRFAEEWTKTQEAMKSAFQPLLERLAELGARLEEATGEAPEVLRKYGWFVNPASESSLIVKVINIDRSERADGEKQSLVDQLFISYFMEEGPEPLRGLIEYWERNEIFRPRMRIFEDCITVMFHEAEGFNSANVILPTLIAQVEGVVKAFLQQYDIHKDKKKRDKWKREFIERVTVDKNEDSKLDELLYLALEQFDLILFQHSTWGEPLQVQTSFNRHKILHGEYLDYGNMTNVIKAFMILDFLAMITKERNT